MLGKRPREDPQSGINATRAQYQLCSLLTHPNGYLALTFDEIALEHFRQSIQLPITDMRLMLLDPSRQYLTVKASLQPTSDSGLQLSMEHVLTAPSLKEIQQTESGLSVPIHDPEDQLVGVLQIQANSSWELHTKLLLDIADSIGVAIHSCIQLRSLKRQAQRLRAVLRLVKLIHKERRLEVIVDQVVKALYKSVFCDRISFFMVDEYADQLWLIRSLDLNEGLRVPARQGLVGYSYTNGEVVCIPDAHRDPRFNAGVDKVTGYRTRSVVCVPVKNKRGKCLAVIQALNKYCEICRKTNCDVHIASFNKYDIQVMKEFAEEIATPLHEVLLSGRTLIEISNAFKRLSDDVRGMLSTFSSEAMDAGSGTNGSSMIRRRSITIRNLDTLQDWGVDYLSFSVEECITMTLQLLQKVGAYDSMKLDPSIVAKFVTTISNHYRPNPYHNFVHAFQNYKVGSLLLWMLKCRSVEILSREEFFSCLIAALCHDVGHQGVNNGFEISVESDLAVRYNDVSVLENFHSALTFEILRQENNDFMKTCESDVRKRFRKNVISGIMATDMTRHHEMISKLKSQLVVSDRSAFIFDTSSASSEAKAVQMKTELIEMLVHSNDLGHTALPWELHVRFSKNLEQEFNEQARRLEERGLPFEEWMKEKNMHDLAKSQAAFMQFVAIPQWATVCEILNRPEIKAYVEDNLKRWKDIVEQNTTV